MSTRMEKYEFEETSQTPSRIKRNAELYQSEDIEDYNKIDINSNVSVLKNDVKDIDVNKIREMLDKKYRDNIPQRKSMDIAIVEDEEETVKPTTKEYDINDIIAQAKTEQSLDYHEERLRKLRDTNYTILNNLDLKSKENKDNEEVNEEDAKLEATKEKELRDLINTITQLEIKNTQKIRIEEENANKPNDLLDLTDDTDSSVLPPSVENSFYTGDLKVKQEDFDDFNEIQEDIKSNSILIRILVFAFIIVLFIIGVIILNKVLDWGLF